jgi:hypothetical protein
MTPAVEKLEQQFKSLSPREQAEAFERLANVVYGEEDEDPAFIATLRRRIAEIDSGAVKGRDAFEVLAEIQAKRSR